MKIYCLTNDNHSHLIEPFLYFWNKYTFNHPVTIAGFKSVGDNFISLGTQLPSSKWSNGLIQLCNIIQDDYFVLMLEDYWLYSHSDLSILDDLTGLMSDDTLRLDLSGNRISHPHYQISRIPGYAIIESVSTAKYLMSFQSGIWDRRNLLKVLQQNENPWQSEIEGSKRVHPLRVLGTSPSVLNYQPTWRSGKRQWQLSKFNQEDLSYIKKWGKKCGISF